MSQVMDLKPEEKEAIEELRMRVKNALTPDMYDDSLLFYRFLKARDFDINKAESMLRKHTVWRKANKVDTILENFTPSPVFLNYIQGTYLGEDNEGSGVRYVPVGKIEGIDIINSFKMNDFLKNLTWLAERDIDHLKKVNTKTSPNASKVVLIANLDKLQFSNAAHPSTLAIWAQMTQMIQDNYPERLKQFYLINAPSYYVIVYSFVKQFMSAAILRKIHIYGRDGWKDELLKVIDADVLPAFLGGNRTDPDGNPMCNTFVQHGGRIPTRYFLSTEDRSFKDKSRIRKIKIFPRKNEEISVKIAKSGSVIQWEYEVDNKDIGFGLYFKEPENKLKEILPVYPISTPDGTENGSYKCPQAGTYAFIFDNTFSRLRTKELSYYISVLEAEE